MNTSAHTRTRTSVHMLNRTSTMTDVRSSFAVNFPFQITNDETLQSHFHFVLFIIILIFLGGRFPNPRFHNPGLRPRRLITLGRMRDSPDGNVVLPR